MCQQLAYTGLSQAAARQASCWTGRQIWVKDVAVCELDTFGYRMPNELDTNFDLQLLEFGDVLYGIDSRTWSDLVSPKPITSPRFPTFWARFP